MAQDQYPTVQGFVQSWADIGITIPILDGRTLQMPTELIAGVKWSRKVELGVRRGKGGKKSGRGVGQETPDGSIIFYTDGYDQFEDALAEVALAKFGAKKVSLVPFDILVQHTPLGSTDIRTKKLIGCRHIGDSEDHAEGTDLSKVEVTLDIMGIERDGISLL